MDTIDQLQVTNSLYAVICNYLVNTNNAICTTVYQRMSYLIQSDKQTMCPTHKYHKYKILVNTMVGIINEI